MLMMFDFDIEYVKGNTISHVDALSGLRFIISESKKRDKFENNFLNLVETDILSRNKLAMIRSETPY